MQIKSQISDINSLKQQLSDRDLELREVKFELSQLKSHCDKQKVENFRSDNSRKELVRELEKNIERLMKRSSERDKLVFNECDQVIRLLTGMDLTSLSMDSSINIGRTASYLHEKSIDSLRRLQKTIMSGDSLTGQIPDSDSPNNLSIYPLVTQVMSYYYS